MGFPLGMSCATLLALLTVGCGEADDTRGQPHSEPSTANGQPIPEVRSTDDIKITGVGATVKLKLDAELRGKLMAALDKDSRQSIRLTIRDVARPATDSTDAAAVIGISVFLEKLDATSATSAEDSHFVGSAIFSADEQARNESFLFDLRPTLLRLRELEKLPPLDHPWQITIVPYLADGVKVAPEKLSLPVKSVSISLPRRKR